MDPWLKNVISNEDGSWCTRAAGSCRASPLKSLFLLDSLDVNLLKIDVDEFEDISLDFQVRAMPTVVFLKNGDEINRFVGARDESGIKEFIVNSMER